MKCFSKDEKVKLARLRYITSRLGSSTVRVSRVLALRACQQAVKLAHPTPPTSSTLVVSGSERSGTTWLARVLARSEQAQIIFEPLRNSSLEGLYAPSDLVAPEANAALERVLKGGLRNLWTDLMLEQVFPQRYLVKLVHGNLLLPYLTERFPVQHIHVLRHPCAVIASRKRGFGGVFRESRVNRMLEQSRLIRDMLEPHLNEIASETTWIGRHAIEWAVENAVARNSRGESVLYEDLLLRPLETLSPLTTAQPGKEELERPSFSSVAQYSSTRERLKSWRKQLSNSEIDTILLWAHRFGHTMYTHKSVPNE